MTTKKTFKKLVSFLLAVIMMFSVMTTAFAAETDVAQTGATKTYYFGVTSWCKIDYIKVSNGTISTNVNASSFTSTGATKTTTVGSASSQTYTIYSVPVDSTYTKVTAYFNHSDGRQFNTSEYTLNENKAILMTEWSGGAQHAQVDYAGSSSTDTIGEFPIDFIEGERKIYLVDQAGWGTQTKCYVWNDSNTGYFAWPGEQMKDTGKTQTINGSEKKILEYTVPAGYTAGVIFYRDDNHRTGDLSFMQYNYYNNESGVWTYKAPISGGDTPTTPPDDPVDKITISFLLNTDTKWVHTDDAKMFIKSGSEIIEMDETIDTKSGHVMWTADVAENSSYTFYRTSYFFDESNAASKPWNTWTASGRNTNTVYKATGSGVGSWAAQSTVNAADPTDITNFWDDLWIDTKGEGRPEDAVKVYYTGSTFHLYVPSYVDLSDVTVYSDHDKVVIGGKEYASGTKANLTTGQHTFAFLDGSTTTNKGNITIYQTESTAAMLMTTKEELFTGTTAGLANNNAWPDGSGITSTNFNNVYKDAIETKGSYYFYDEEGNLVNSDPVLKKIKGRGNSSFEASMKLYGKYAYNFNLDSKVALIDGSTASKKWCLLANNVDHAMLRNTFVYALADDIGIKYSPETRLVDVYDNGKYLGAYVITEKVEYGKNTLMSDMKNLDDGNEDANIEAYQNEDIMDDLEGHLIQAESSVTVNGQTYTYQYTKSDDETNWPYHQPADFEEYNYLLEFELFNRYKNEASWFVSPRTGQAVVVKYPEFATKDEMEWIISEFETAESAIYANDTDAIKAAVDVDSFAKMYLIQELAINLDSCATSYYIHNDLTSGKLVSSPVWDYDWAFGAYAKDLKYIYNGSSVTTSANMSDPKQMFVKNKALKTDSGDTTKKANYNFQAKLVHNDYVWERCQYIWTNDFVDALNYYVVNTSVTGDTKGVIQDEWLPKFESSVNMNNARWGALTYEGDDWGTKVTSDYNKGSRNFYVGNCYQSGTNSASYANTVYYLNDWIATRWDYMSSSTGGNLYNEELKATYEITDVTFEGVQDNTDDTQLTVTPSATVTMNGVAVDAADIIWNVYVNGTLAYSSNFTEESHTVTLASGANEVYVVVGVKDTDESVESSVQTFNTYVPNYTIDNVTFKAEQSADESQLTVTPSAVAKLDGVELTASEYQYTIYLNGKVVAGPVTFETVSTTINLEEGKVNEVYIVVTPVGVTTVSAKSATEKFAYAVEFEKVEATLYFKSSSSLRYRPYVSVAGADKVEMTKSGSAIGRNATQTQSYYWYTATVEIDKDKATKLTFTNSYAMNGVVTVTLSEDADALYFGVDNLNDGAVAENLTDASEYVRNFTKSSTHMVHNDAYDPAGVATTSIDGTIYKMGDADGDNVVSVMDSTTMQRALAGKTELSETNSALADFDLNEVNSITDATKVQKFLVA